MLLYTRIGSQVSESTYRDMLKIELETLNSNSTTTFILVNRISRKVEGYRIFVRGIMYDISKETFDKLPKENKHTIHNLVVDKLMVDEHESLIISPLERFTLNGETFNSIELHDIEQIVTITNRLKTKEPVEKSSSPLDSISPIVEKSSSPLDSISPKVEKSSSPIDEDTINQIMIYLSELPKLRSLLEHFTTIYTEKDELNQPISENIFDSSIPLTVKNSSFLLHLFERIDTIKSEGKSNNFAYNLVLSEMNKPDTHFNSLMNNFTNSKGRKTKVSVHTIKDYYTRRFIKVGNTIYHKGDMENE